MDKEYRFVFDTNSLISAFLISNSVSYAALSRARSMGSLLTSDETYKEFAEVFSREKFDKYVSLKNRKRIVDGFRKIALSIEIKTHLHVSRDKNDDKFLDLAIDGNASCIITGDSDLLVLHPFQEIPILAPGDFLSTFP